LGAIIVNILIFLGAISSNFMFRFNGGF
jgi:hypothetical protein